MHNIDTYTSKREKTHNTSTSFSDHLTIMSVSLPHTTKFPDFGMYFLRTTEVMLGIVVFYVSKMSSTRGRSKTDDYWSEAALNARLISTWSFCSRERELWRSYSSLPAGYRSSIKTPFKHIFYYHLFILFNLTNVLSLVSKVKTEQNDSL